MEQVLAIDRSSLLSEIQDLRSQLRMAHLQNQEKLQQLQDALTSAEEKGHTKEHQLRKHGKESVVYCVGHTFVGKASSLGGKKGYYCRMNAVIKVGNK